MTIIKKLVLANICGVVGAILSLMVITGSTNFWLWTGIAAAAICSLNLFVLTQHRRHLAGVAGKAKMGMTYLVVSLILTGIALVIQFAFR